MEEAVSRAEFEALKKAVEEVKCMVGELAKVVAEPRVAGIYHCSEEGCSFQTDDLGAYIEHSIDERLKKSAFEEEVWEEEPKRHRSVTEFLECPECYPKFLNAMLEHPRFQKTLKEHGWEKPEPKPKSGLPSLEI